MWMKSWTGSRTLGSRVKLRPYGQSELSKVERVRFQRSCRLFIIRLKVARSPKIFVWRCQGIQFDAITKH